MPLNEIVFAVACFVFGVACFVFGVACFVFGVFTITGAVSPPRYFNNFWVRLIYVVLTIAAWSCGLYIIIN